MSLDYNFKLARSRAATMTTLAPTYLGPRYPGGLFGTVDLGVDTAVRSSSEIFLNFKQIFSQLSGFSTSGWSRSRLRSPPSGCWYSR